VNTPFLATLLLIGAAMQANAQGNQRPEVPDQIKAPPAEDLVLVVRASGSQIYTCQQGADGKPTWTLKAPDAELRDLQGSVVGKHYAGPTWKHNDGSEVTGKMSAKVNAPDADSIPWLLLSATGHSGNGVLSKVSSIQRVHTKGGQPPAGVCEASAGEKKIAYTADYYFYAAK